MPAFRPIPAVISIALTFIIWFIPAPDGVTPQAWHLLALFVGTISAIIGKVMPIGALSIIAITLVAITGVTVDPNASNRGSLAIKDALSGFSNSLIWLIGISIMVSKGLSKTGLGNRIGYWFLSLFGKKTLGIGYSLAFSELAIAPITPSNTARGGGIIHPIMRSIAESLGSTGNDDSSKKVGEYLALVNYNTNPITSAMFITATAPNPLVVDIIAKGTGLDIQITWMQWFLAALLPGVVALIIMPYVLYLFFTPELKTTPNATHFAHEKLKQLGNITHGEKIMLGTFLVMLILWAGLPVHLLTLFGAEASLINSVDLNATTVAFLGLCILLVTGVLTWDDILKERSAWDTIVWFSALVMMASFLSKLGLISWFATLIEVNIGSFGLPWWAATILLCSVYFYAHYFFASTTAHITAMLGAFFAAGIGLGVPPMFLGLALAGASSLMMSLTHYGTGTAPVIYGSGYVSLGNWWKAGFIMSVVNLTVWSVVGSLWWKVLGYW